MKMKLTTLMFSLLLAVGWTSNVFAQPTTYSAESIKDLTYSWTDASGVTHSDEHYVKYDDEKKAWVAPEVSDPYQIYGLLRGVYMEKKLPGPWQSAFDQNNGREDDIYYGGVKKGWDIPGTHVSGGATSTIGSKRITVSNGNDGYYYTPARIYSIKIVSGSTVISSWDYATNGNSLPSGMSLNSGNTSIDYETNDNGQRQYYLSFLGSGGSIDISAALTAGYPNVEIVINAKSVTGMSSISVGGTSKDINTAYYSNFAWNFNGVTPEIFASNTYKPEKEGYTAIVVALKNTPYIAPEPSGFGGSSAYTQPSEVINYIKENIQFVKLLTDGLRITDASGNPGTVFNCDGTYNKFFFLGKGKARQKGAEVLANINNGTYPEYAGECVIFWPMYEEFSPQSAKLVGASTTVDFFDRMMEGNIYDVVHDCAGVIQNRHEFSLAGEEGTDDYAFTAMNFFIPDYRLKYWVGRDSLYNNGSYTYYDIDGRDMNAMYKVDGSSLRDVSAYYSNYAQYNPDYAPKVGIYKITLSATATFVGNETNPDHTPGNLNYVVTLQWVSSLNEMSGTTVPQTYTIYCFDNVTGEKFELEATGVTNPTGQTTVSYLVPQREHSYTIEYIVQGSPNDSDHPTFVAWSNRDFVVIPGWDDFVGLQLDHHESDFVSNEMANYYRNFLEVVNEDVYNGLTLAEITGSNGQAPMREFTLYRFEYEEVKNSETGEVELVPKEPYTPIAKLTFGNPNADGTVPYTVQYEDKNPQVVENYTLGTVTDAYSVDNLGIPLSDVVRVKGNGDLVIWPNSYHANFKSIKVYNGNTLVTSWDYTQDDLPDGSNGTIKWIVSPGSKWEVFYNTTNSDKVGYMEGGGYIAIPGIVTNPVNPNLRVEIVAYGDGSSVSRISVNDRTQTLENRTAKTYKWGGNGADDVPISPYAAPRRDNTNNNSNN
jgi:hypothetical protein